MNFLPQVDNTYFGDVCTKGVQNCGKMQNVYPQTNRSNDLPKLFAESPVDNGKTGEIESLTGHDYSRCDHIYVKTI